MSLLSSPALEPVIERTLRRACAFAPCPCIALRRLGLGTACGDLSCRPSNFLSRPVGDKLLDITDLERFLRENIKVQGKTGNLVSVRVDCTRYFQRFISDSPQQALNQKPALSTSKLFVTLPDNLEVISNPRRQPLTRPDNTPPPPFPPPLSERCRRLARKQISPGF